MQVLLECQFDQNDRFKTAVNKSHESFALRKDPIGRDQDGLIYWYHEVNKLQLCSKIKFNFFIIQVACDLFLNEILECVQNISG